MRSDRFSRVVTEGVTLSAVDLSIQAEIPSGPVALEVTRLVRKKWTSLKSENPRCFKGIK